MIILYDHHHYHHAGKPHHVHHHVHHRHSSFIIHLTFRMVCTVSDEKSMFSLMRHWMTVCSTVGLITGRAMCRLSIRCSHSFVRLCQSSANLMRKAYIPSIPLMISYSATTTSASDDDDDDDEAEHDEHDDDEAEHDDDEADTSS